MDSPDRGLNPGPSNYASGALPTPPGKGNRIILHIIFVRKITEKMDSPDRDLNPGPSDYASRDHQDGNHFFHSLFLPFLAGVLLGVGWGSGETITTPRKVLEHLVRGHFPESTIEHPGECPEVGWTRTGSSAPDWELAAKIVTLDRLQWAVASFEMWREVRVAFIPKPGKCSYDNAKAYRPISLSSFLLKTLERLVDRQIKEGALRFNQICSSQHAYQAGRSTETALHHLVGTIENAKERGVDTLGVFIDIEGAFNNTSFDTLEKAAASFGIEESVSKWIAAMLRTRVVHSTLGDSAVRAVKARGCPQGGVISPLLWFLVVDGLLTGLEELGIRTVAYADDVALLVTSRDASMLHGKMQKALDYVQHWCTSKGLRVNPGKTEMVHFTSRRRAAVKAPSIYNTVQNFSTEVNYLGIWLDKKLSWKKHIAMQTNNVTMTYWACRRMFGSTWGLRPRMVKWIYTAIMTPQLTYAAAVWWSALNNACHRKAVDRVGRLAMLGITGALRTTPCSALEALVFMQPPHLIIREEATKAAATLRLQGTWKGARNGHASVLRTDRELEGLLSRGADACRPRWHFRRKFSVNLGWGETPSGKDADWAPPRGLIWYTDGSRVSGRVGAGVWSEVPAIARAIGLDSHATALQTELAALRTCSRMILGRGDKGKKIFIFSDSRRALRSILRYECCSKLVSECVERMEEIAVNNRLEVAWIPGHAGIKGNEKADELAKNGSSRAFQGEVEHVGVHTDFVNDLVKERGDRRIVERWDSETGARHTKSFLGKPTWKIPETLLGLNRAKLGAIVGLITGHWPLALYLSRIGKGTNPLCKRCGLTEEDPLHLCTRCSGLDEVWWDVFGSACTDIWIDRDGIKGLYEFARRALILDTSDRRLPKGRV
ncbi:uncharacterized protein LOC135161459 [Diachasmimorpha longicaudata]|uniref:uncharacterized protein LOC135161459 n=1 Tax=Diachasmimorpha longicaudata TaxID=58733 RepID=UPI0030B9126F